MTFPLLFRKQAMDEVEFHAQLKHKNIVQYYYSWIEVQTIQDQLVINSWITKVTGAYASDSKADSLESDDDPADFPVDTETEPENVSDNKEYL
jgi:hypothetical protein